jgi:acetyl-CoA synthetase
VSDNGDKTKHIESALNEKRSFPPSAQFVARARIKQRELAQLYQRAQTDHVGFWSDLGRSTLHWRKPFTTTLDESDAPNYRWFTDGILNVSWNCLDAHLAEHGHKTAIIFEGEPGDSRRLSYRELHADVCRFANALRSLGIQRGDRVVIYMPMVPEAVVAMQACARIGAVHSVVFGGFSAAALRDRIGDAEARAVITADGGWRGGHALDLKGAVDKALNDGCPSVEHVVVLKRTGADVAMVEGRDLWWHELVQGQAPQCEPEWVDAEHPLFLLYTSGSTGKPKGIQHASAGYLLNARLTCDWVFDLRDDDVFWCTADVGWVTGHTYVAYGPLAAGATIVMYEGAPTVPDGGRFWKMCAAHGVTVFYTAPTAIRALMKLGDDIPRQHDLSKLRLLGTVGEPINPEAWMWYHRVIGGERCPIVDTWWQTETGAILISPIPGVVATKPGSCTRPLPGIDADIVDDRGKSVKKPGAGGNLVIRKPWPSLARTLWRENDRYLSTYWAKFKNRFYVAGDGANRDADGYFWIVGRIDDVLNVAGHRLGTMEIESALGANPKVAEAAVVGKPHDVKGESVFAFVVTRGDRPQGEQAAKLIGELRAWVAQELSPIAKPDDIRFADALPKTRSGKIMRRLLRSIARGEKITQDVSTLENPAIVAQLLGEQGSGAAATPKAAPRAKAKLKPEPKPKPKPKPKAKVKAKVKVKVKAKVKAKVTRPVKAKAKSKAKNKAKPNVAPRGKVTPKGKVKRAPARKPARKHR